MAIILYLYLLVKFFLVWFNLSNHLEVTGRYLVLSCVEGFEHLMAIPKEVNRNQVILLERAYAQIGTFV